MEKIKWSAIITKKGGRLMTSDVLEKQIEALPADALERVSQYVNMLYIQNVQEEAPKSNSNKYGRKFGIAKTVDYWIAPDFNDTPDCFEEYM